MPNPALSEQKNLDFQLNSAFVSDSPQQVGQHVLGGENVAGGGNLDGLSGRLSKTVLLNLNSFFKFILLVFNDSSTRTSNYAV